MSFNAMSENKFVSKISESTVSTKLVLYICQQRRLLRDCEDVQARLSLLCSSIPLVPKSHVLVQLHHLVESDPERTVKILITLSRLSDARRTC